MKMKKPSAIKQKPSAIKLLKEDHKTVNQLFKRFEAAGDKAYQLKKKIVDQIIEELEVHMKVEEEIFYPAVDNLAPDKTRDMVAEAYEEHKLVKDLIGDLKSLPPSDRKYSAKTKVVIDLIRHHVEEEEGEFFPNAKKLLGEEDKVLGEEIQARKENLMGKTKSNSKTNSKSNSAMAMMASWIQ